MTKNKKNNQSFLVVLVTIIFVFTSLMLLSIPVLFDYESVENKIEKKISSEFKIDMKILGKITYKILPKPHILIEKANLYLDQNNNKSSIIETEDLKIFIPISSIYSKSNILIDKLEIEDSNITFKFQDLKDFRNHLFYKINKPKKINNSKFFYIDNDSTLLISPINSLDYFIDDRNKYKELKIKGNIFNLDYMSSWKRYYDKPNSTYHEINFNNPNILLKNFFNFKNKSNYSGKVSGKFLNEHMNIEYYVNNNSILIRSSEESINEKIKISSNIELDPFYFTSKISLIEKDPKFIIDNILYFIYNLESNLLGNLNGKLTLNIKKLNNEIIDNGIIELVINEQTINMQEAKFQIKDVGFIKSKFSFYEKQGEIIFRSSNVLEIINQKAFARKFLLTNNKFNEASKIFFDLERNLENDQFLISNLNIKKVSPEQKTDEKVILKNIQLLRKILLKTLN